jgi:phosphoribosyl-AMP cyclohydrolase
MSLSAKFKSRGTAADIEGGDTFQPKFDADGLIPVIVTDAAAAGTVLMFAWMNAEALALTIETGVAHFWTRSRQKLWKKGEESGNLLIVRQMRTDCDQDALWLSVTIQGAGVACHTGAESCFYRAVPLQSHTANEALVMTRV